MMKNNFYLITLISYLMLDDRDIFMKGIDYSYYYEEL